MSFLDDLARNVGNFFNGNDEKKRPQVVVPQNTLRQTSIGQTPAQSVNRQFGLADNSNNIRQAALANQAAAAEKKKRDELARQAAIAKQQADAAARAAMTARQSNQVVPPIAAPLLTPQIGPVRPQAAPQPAPVLSPQATREKGRQISQVITNGRIPDGTASLLNPQEVAQALARRKQMNAPRENGLTTAILGAAQGITNTFIKPVAESADTLVRQTEVSARAKLAGANQINPTASAALNKFVDEDQRNGLINQQQADIKRAEIKAKLDITQRAVTQAEKASKVKLNQNEGANSLVSTIVNLWGLPELAVNLARTAGKAAIEGGGKEVSKIAKDAYGTIVQEFEKVAGKKATSAEKDSLKTEIAKEIEHRAAQNPPSTPNPTTATVPEPLPGEPVINNPVAPETPITSTEPAFQPVTPNQMSGLVRSGPAGATSIIRSSGRRFAPEVERQITEELGMARTPELVKAVLNKYGIPIQETPAEALARQTVSGEQVATQQAKALDGASQEVVPQEVVPQAANTPQQTAAPSADIAQNSDAFAPQVGKTIDANVSLTEARKTPINQRTPEQTDEITRLQGEVKTKKQADEFVAVQQKLANNEQLTPKEESVFQRVMGVPKQKGAVERATTLKADRTPDPRQAENPAVLPQDDGSVKVLTKGGKAADDKAQLAQDINKEGSRITSRADDYFRPVENITASLRRDAPAVGKHVDDLRSKNQAAAAEQVRGVEKGQNIGDGVFSGISRADENEVQYLIENYSNKGVISKVKAERPELYAKVTQAREYFQGQLDKINTVLVDYGEKPIGDIKDYFPRIQKIMKDKSHPLHDLLLDETTSSSAFGEARMSKGFQKERTLEDQAGNPARPYDAFMQYVRQSETLINRLPVIKEINNFKTVVEATDVKNLPPPAKKQLTDLFDNMSDQLTGANRPTTGAGKTAAAIGNISSRSGVAYSLNTVLTQMTAPVTLLVRRVTDAGLIKGTASTIGIVGRAIRNAKYIGKDAVKMTNIDGMESDYLVSALGHAAPKKHLGQRFIDRGYKTSSYGDVQYRSAAVEQIYLDSVKAGAPRGKATLRKAENDVRLALADRTPGERSKFTSSGNALAQLTSKYQVEQVAQVYNFIDGVMLNPKASPWRKSMGALAAVGGAYGLNSATGAISGGTVKPLPDIYGAGVDAFATVQEQDQERIKNGTDPLTSEQKAGLFMANMGSNFVSNLPMGRTALSIAAAGANAIGANPAINNKNLAKDIGLNPRDTNPLQTFPAVGTVMGVVGDANDAITGKKSILEAASTATSRVLPGGGQVRRTVQGVDTFIKGGDKFKNDTNKETGVVTPGDTKFTVNNNLSTPEGIGSLTQSVLFGKFSSKGAQDYIKSGFQTQSERDVKNKTYSADDVLNNLTQDQAKAYKTAVDARFGNSLSGNDKALYKFVTNKDEVDRQITAGKLTQATVDDLKVRMNKNLFDNGLGYKIDNGFNKDDKSRAQFKAFPSEVQNFIVKQSMTSKKNFKEQDSSDEAKSVIGIATGADELWPSVQDVTPTNALAQKWVDYQKALGENPDDQAAQFTARKKFWSAAVKQGFDSKAVGVYDSSDDGGSTNAKGTYAMSIANIKTLVSPNGMTVGGKNYRINKTDLDSMVELDNRLLRAGLIAKPKFSNKTRTGFGYGAAPASELDSVGYAPDAGGGSGKDKTVNSRAGDFLTNFGGKTNEFKLNIAGKEQAATPDLNLARFGNKGSKSAKSSIKITL